MATARKTTTTKKEEAKEEKLDKVGATLTQEQKKQLENLVKVEEPVQYIETGDVGLDLALSDGKGLPIGSSTLLWAKPGSGKTTVVADACKRLIEKFKKKGEIFKVLYIGVEDSSGLLSALGLDPYRASGDFLYAKGQICWRQVEGLYTQVLNNDGIFAGVKLVVIDSVNNVLSDQNTKNSVADGDFGTRNRERSNFYSKFLPLCKERGISSFFISQIRKKQAVASPYEDPNRAAVSDVDLHNVDIIMKCTASTNTTDASKIIEKTVFGEDKVASKCIFKMDSKATDCKNRYIRGNAVELLFEKGKKVHNYYTIGKLLEGNKFIKKNGSYLQLDPELCKAFKLPEGNLRRAELNKILEDHAGDFVGFLKKIGKYKVSIKETEVPVTEEEVQAETEKGQEE